VPSRRKWFGIARIIAAITAIVALIGDVNFTIGTSPFAIGNFFSYFTVQSMMLAVLVFSIAALIALRQPRDPVWLDQVRALVTTYVTVSGIVFAVLLVEGTTRGVPVWAPWSSQILHFVLPAYALLDWWLAPGREVPWKTLGIVMLFPAVWVVYTMIPFELALYLLAIVAVFSLIVALLIALSRRHHPRSPVTRATGGGTVRGSRALRRGTPGRSTRRVGPQPHRP
jgi:hypothetical protein